VASERFVRSVVEILAKRAGNTCSNPECGALTAGPADDQDRAIVVGEAAHIYGARPGSARFLNTMTDASRGDVTNGIWLCRNCHKMVDADPAQFPAELLFEWRRDHERLCLASLGKAGTLRQRVIDRRLEGFERCSYLAQQIILDKPKFWEHKLTAELLRSSLQPIAKRWDALHRGLYALPARSVETSDYIPWFRAQMPAMSGQVHALAGLVNGELQASWGPPGEPGSEHEIHRLCGLVAEACQRLLEWEEGVRSVVPPDEFTEAHRLLVGIGGRFINEIARIPDFLAAIFSADDPSGSHELMLVFDLPDRWADDLERALGVAERRLKRRW